MNTSIADATTNSAATHLGREAFIQRLDLALSMSEGLRGGFAVLLVGPPAECYEDAAAAHVAAAAIGASIRHSDTVVALNDSEFGVLLAMGNGNGAQRVASKIIRSLASALGEQVAGNTSIGIALAPAHGKSREQLMRAADGALYQARRNRLGIVMAVASEEMSADSAPAQELGQHIENALQQNEFVLRFQPVIELANSRLQWAEALARWQHPSLGLLPPAEFLHLLERNEKADVIALQLIDCAITQLRDWRNEGLNIPVSVNFSLQTLAMESMEQSIVGKMHALSLPPESLMIEIRDDNLAQLSPQATRTLFALAAAGIQICLDDFGNGTASLSALRDLPVHEIKIAPQFVTPICRSKADAAIVASLVQLGHNLGKRVVAKGVEDTETRSALGELGCRYAQGFAFAQALDALVLSGWQAAQG